MKSRNLSATIQQLFDGVDTGGPRRGDLVTSAKSAASYLIQLSSKEKENDLTNLKLQKLLFYAQAEHLNRTGRPFFEDEIEAWTYGPVISEIYHWLKPCGSYPVTIFDVQADAEGLNDEEREFLDVIWECYGKFSPGYLVSKTHSPDSPWRQVFKERDNAVIPTSLIKNTELAVHWQ